MTSTVYTSIAPSHPINGQQERSAASWVAAGHRYVTVNTIGEATPPNINRKDARDTRAIYGKPYVLLDEHDGAAPMDGVFGTTQGTDLEALHIQLEEVQPL